MNMTLREKYTLGQLNAFHYSVFIFIHASRICNLTDDILISCSYWQRGLRRGYAAVRLLRLWVRIPPEPWMSVC